MHDHARLDLARAGRHEDARALELDDADAADVRRPQGLAVAERRRLDAELRAGVEDRRALGDPHRLAVDLELDRALGVSSGVARRHQPFSRKTPSRPIGRLDRARGGLAEAADRGVAHALADLGDQRELAVDAAARLAARAAAPAPPPGAPCRRGTARTARTTRRGRRRRCASASAAGRPSRRRPGRRRSRASCRRRARPRRSAAGRARRAGRSRPPRRRAARPGARGRRARRRRARAARAASCRTATS